MEVRKAYQLKKTLKEKFVLQCVNIYVLYKIFVEVAKLWNAIWDHQAMI